MWKGDSMEDSAGKKFDKGKARLELLPPSYWFETGCELSWQMSTWYFYQGAFLSNFGYDATPVLEFGAESMMHTIGIKE